MENVGKKFYRWTILERVQEKGKGKKYKCQCECGKIKEKYLYTIKNGSSKSCGCLHKEINSKRLKESNKTHGESKTRLYRTWASMKERCYSRNSTRYEEYGSKGIKVCDEWHSYINFREWALSSGYTDELTIDRINSYGNYEPNNCQWITKSENTKRRNDEHGIPIPKSSFTEDDKTIAMNLRGLGYTYEKIGKELGCSGVHARNIIVGDVKNIT